MHVTAKCKELRSLVVNDLNSLDSTTLLHILSILAGRQKNVSKNPGKQRRHLITSLILKKAKFSLRKELRLFISRLITVF
jgi:hypothetical protein